MTFYPDYFEVGENNRVKHDDFIGAQVDEENVVTFHHYPITSQVQQLTDTYDKREKQEIKVKSEVEGQKVVNVVMWATKKGIQGCEDEFKKTEGTSLHQSLQRHEVSA